MKRYLNLQELASDTSIDPANLVNLTIGVMDILCRLGGLQFSEQEYQTAPEGLMTRYEPIKFSKGFGGDLYLCETINDLENLSIESFEIDHARPLSKSLLYSSMSTLKDAGGVGLIYAQGKPAYVMITTVMNNTGGPVALIPIELSRNMFAFRSVTYVSF